MSADDLANAVKTTLTRCLAVKPGENVLVVCDPTRTHLGEAFVDAAREMDADAVLVVLPPRPQRGTEPPATVAGAFANCDVFIAPCLPSLSHTVARRTANENGARGATLPGVEEEMFARLMSADFSVMEARSKAVAELLDAADVARVTCPLGTDMHFDISGRRGMADDGRLTESGAMGNLPCGEGFVAPLGGEGTIVASSLAMLGIADEPVTVSVVDGKLADASGAVGEQLVEMLTAHGELGRNLAELGVGTNERATLTGNVLEDEKLLGSVHIAFGASQGIGGTVTVPVHIDVVVLDATLRIGDALVLDAGRYVL